MQPNLRTAPKQQNNTPAQRIASDCGLHVGTGQKIQNLHFVVVPETMEREADPCSNKECTEDELTFRIFCFWELDAVELHVFPKLSKKISPLNETS